jgi:hypothetical protein
MNYPSACIAHMRYLPMDVFSHYRTISLTIAPFYVYPPAQLTHLSTRRGLAHHLRLLFLKPLPDPLAASHELRHAPGDAAGLARDQGLGGKVIDAGVEAVGNEIGKHLHSGLSAWWMY